MFISKPYEGQIYLARYRRGQLLRWSVIPVATDENEIRIEASAVPPAIRERAYDLFERDRLRDGTPARVDESPRPR